MRHSVEFRIQETVEKIVSRIEASAGGKGGEAFVVGLLRVRNAVDRVALSLESMSHFAHAIVVLDDASEDGTIESIRSVADDCKVSMIISKPRPWSPDKYGDMHQLLEEGRNIGGTHFLVLHHDEMFTTSLMDDSAIWWVTPVCTPPTTHVQGMLPLFRGLQL